MESNAAHIVVPAQAGTQEWRGMSLAHLPATPPLIACPVLDTGDVARPSPSRLPHTTVVLSGANAESKNSKPSQANKPPHCRSRPRSGTQGRRDGWVNGPVCLPTHPRRTRLPVCPPDTSPFPIPLHARYPHPMDSRKTALHPRRSVPLSSQNARLHTLNFAPESDSFLTSAKIWLDFSLVLDITLETNPLLRHDTNPPLHAISCLTTVFTTPQNRVMSSSQPVLLTRRAGIRERRGVPCPSCRFMLPCPTTAKQFNGSNHGRY